MKVNMQHQDGIFGIRFLTVFVWWVCCAYIYMQTVTFGQKCGHSLLRNHILKVMVRL